jgi:hypothetical protein
MNEYEAMQWYAHQVETAMSQMWIRVDKLQSLTARLLTFRIRLSHKQ